MSGTESSYGEYRTELTINHDHAQIEEFLSVLMEDGVSVGTMEGPVSSYNGEAISARSMKFKMNDMENIQDFMFPVFLDPYTFSQTERTGVLLERVFGMINEHVKTENVKEFIFYKLHGQMVQDRSKDEMFVVWTIRGHIK